MKRRILSVLVSVLLVVCSVYPGFVVAEAAVWDGSKNIPAMSGGVYQIATAENLAWFAYAVNTGSGLLKAELTADIQLNADGSAANEWTPIGDFNHPFGGSFDGNGYTVSGMYVDSAASDYLGLFGYVKVADDDNSETVDVSPEYIVANKVMNVKNLNVTNATVIGHQNIGGLIGAAYNAGIENCTFSGSVSGSYNSVGGIVGWADAETVVEKCMSEGSVTGAQRTGGIVGYESANSVISRSYADADVTGTSNVGGIAGTVAGSNVVGAFFFGSVTANSRAGGIVGYSAFGLLRSAYSMAEITSAGTDIGGAVGVTYGGEYSALFYNFESADFNGAEGIGRTAKDMASSSFVKELNLNFVYFCYDYTNINSGYPVLTWMLQTDAWTGDMSVPSTDASGAYIISKPSELAWFAALVNGTLPGTEANPSANAVVSDDLLMNINAYDETMGRSLWTPIGTPEYPYTGTFNGGNYNIAGLYLNANAAPDGKYIGLFGYVGAGSIINTVLVDGYITGVENVGGIAGYLAGGTVSNCNCSSEIVGDKAVGGIVGFINTNSKISNSCMLGTVCGADNNADAADQNIGGIVGYNNRSEITKCFSYAEIGAPSSRFVGGIAGNNATGTVTMCYSTSTVIGSATVGGIIGQNSNGTVKDCYTAGAVKGASLAGMAFGSTSGANVSNCYFDGSLKTMSNILVGATELKPTEMTGASALSNMSLSSSEWKTAADDTYYYYYPQLSVMANSSSVPIRAASIESVKRVQNKYVAKVEIDGRTDTFYETLEAAIAYASNTSSSVLPAVYVIRDITLNSTVTVASTMRLFGENGASLIRGTSLTGPMLNVTGNLIIGFAAYGSDDAPSFIIDGGNVAATQSGIVVAKTATLKIEKGTSVENFRTINSVSTAPRGAALAVNGGTLNVSGGVFKSNSSKTVGGSIYSEEGTVTITGGVFRGCTATQGAAVYNNDGVLTVSGGSFIANVESTYGGAVAANGVYSKTVITGAAEFKDNAATYGGALSVRNYGTLEISGGEISGNRAYSSGGALYIDTGAEALISGGSVHDNYVDEGGQGAGVYNGAVLSLKGAAQIDSGNDIYLLTGKYITIPDRLTCSGYAAVITPQSYFEKTKVIDGAGMGANYSKIAVSNRNWRTLSNGTMTSRETTTVAILSKPGSYSVEYISLADAFDAVLPNETAIITVVADNLVTRTIEVNGDVTVTCDDSAFTSTRDGSFRGVMFNVNPGAVLRLGDSVITPTQQSQSDYIAGIRTAGQFIIDGGYTETGVIGAAVINVCSGAELHMDDDAVIENNNSATTSAITVSGTMNMLGGTVSGNISRYGGAVYVKADGVLNMMGGVISGNTSQNGGDAVYAEGTVNRVIQKYDYYYVETLYDDEGSQIGSADPVYQCTAKTDAMLADGEAVYLSSNVINVFESEQAVNIYVTSLDKLPASTELKLNMMTLDFAEYTVGGVVVAGANAAESAAYFRPKADGYFITADGKLGLNKIVAKASSGLNIDRGDNTVYGERLVQYNIGSIYSMLENDRRYLRFCNSDGSAMTNTQKVTTGCTINLLDTSNKVIDTVTVVVFGDVNGDYAADAQDSVLILAVADGMLGADDLTAAQLKAGDVNFDGSVTFIDAEHTDASGLYLQTISQSNA